MRRIVSIVLTAMCALSSSRAWAQDWVKVLSLPQTSGASAFFFNENEGLIGTGDYLSDIPAQIYFTTDAGTTWTQANVWNPNINGQVTDIFFRDRMHGWATIREYTESGWTGVYHSTDGGKTWVRVRQAEFPVAVRETSRGVFYTDRDLNPGVMFSSDTGKTWRHIATTQEALGIDFMNDSTGFVTSQATSALAPHLLTTDGGNTWRNIATSSEAWTAYGDAVSHQFFIASERDPLTYVSQTSVLEFPIAASTESRIRSYSDSGLTGGIAGSDVCQSIIYVQGREPASFSPKGFIRTTDDGATWKQIFGPSTINDKRFAVTGRGAVVYAFDHDGGVWRTADGGDGTLSPSILPFVTIGLPLDTARSSLCDSAVIPVVLVYRACDSAQITEVSFLNDSLQELSIDGNMNRFFSTADSNTFQIIYRPERAEQWSAAMQITIRQPDGFIEDTTVFIPIEAVGGSKGMLAVSESNHSTSEPGTISFDSVSICGNGYETITLRDTGCGSVAIDSIAVSGNAFSLASTMRPFELSPHNERSFLLECVPDSIGKRFGLLEIFSQLGIDSIPLTAIGYAPSAGIAISVPDTITAPNCDSTAFSVAFQNIACQALRVDSIHTSLPFRIVSVPTVDSLSSDSSVVVSLEFVPIGVGLQKGTVTLAVSYPGTGIYDTELSIAATGTVGAEQFALSSASLAMGTVPICGEASDTLVLHSSGCDSVQVSAQFDTSVGFSLVRAPKTGLAPNDSDTVIVQFLPHGLGPKAANLILATSLGTDTVPVSIEVVAGGGALGLAVTPNIASLTCRSSPFSISIRNGFCDSITVDSIHFIGSASNEFSIADSSAIVLASHRQASWSGTFAPDDTTLDSITFSMAIHEADGMIHDTTIQLRAQGIAVPPIEAALGATSFSAGIGQTVTIPIVVKQGSVVELDSLDFSLAINTNVLTPIAVSSTGIFGEAAVKNIDVTQHSTSIHLKLNTAQILGTGELCEVLCVPYVSAELSTPIVLEGLNFYNAGSQECLLSETVPDTVATFTLFPTCGDSLISQFLETGRITLERISPNPTDGIVHLTFFVPEVYSNNARLEIYNTLGEKLSEMPITFSSSGEQTIDANLATENPATGGVRYLRIVTPERSITAKVLLVAGF